MERDHLADQDLGGWILSHVLATGRRGLDWRIDLFDIHKS
jgi:hypothetical protein